MQRNTRKRIAYYQEALPDVKKRVAAAALMLFVAVLVSVVASYAWVTLSMAPVVSSIDTTVSSNGTLEIALSPADGSQPTEFDIDESVMASTDVTVSNLQWGNLINLSDASYGLDNMVLRPAQLNTTSLKNSPLWGAVYGADGRISTLDSNYTFVAWNGKEFEASRDYGVRGIASYKVTVSDSTSAAQRTLAEEANAAHSAVNTQYQKIHTMLQSMSSMLSTYTQNVIAEQGLGPSGKANFSVEELKNAYELYATFFEGMELHKDALVALAKYQAFVAGTNPTHNYADIDWDYLVANKAKFNAASTTATSTDGVISLVGLTSFISDLNLAEKDLSYLKTYYEMANSGALGVGWNTGGTSGYQLSNIISRLLRYDTLTIFFQNKEMTVGELGSFVKSDLVTNALALMNLKETKVTLYDGILKNFEQFAVDEGYRMQGNQSNATVDVKATAEVSVISKTVTIKGLAYTAASGPSTYSANYSQAMGQQMAPSDAIAEDTYGMAVDFWLRTNAEETYLTLEGALVTDEQGSILSYDGINRVWGSTDATSLTTNSTTQGGGSCYIYYADTPEDMNRSLDLLRSMKVALVDADGNLMASAVMDTQNYYAVNGRITVPLVIEENSGVTYTYTDETNAEKTGRAIVRMNHDEAKWVTAIVYLDGAYLGNDHVLSAADIDGQLNIQFGSSQDLKTRGDNNLLTAERVVTASVDKNSFNFITAVNASELTTNVTVRVEGTDPENVTAFFVRAINNTQGERQDTMTFTKQADGTWTTSYAFKAPGTYYLRHVRLDRVDYTLENPPMVEVTGFSVESVSWGEATKEATVYSPENYYEEPVSVKLASSDASKMPKTVQARFLRDDGNIVNVDMSYDPTTFSWKGTGTFSTAGQYTLQFLLLDGEYYDISNHGYKMTLYLGLGVTVYNNGSTTNDRFETGKVYDKHVGVKIADNAGNELTAMEGAKLYYSMGGSATNTVDTDLTWDEVNNWYNGTLPIKKAGRYAFQRVTIAGSNLTRYTEAPSYIIVSPDPPQYVTSTGHFYGKTQFAPLTNDAYIGPIKIDHAESATLSVTVYNDETGETVTIQADGVVNPVDEKGKYTNSHYYQGGRIYYEGDYWYVDLPSYTNALDADGDPTADATYTQEGTWSVKSISAWDCYDETSTFRDETTPIVWTDTDVDYSKLTTDVSCSINVTMTYGDTKLGSATEPFMTEHSVKDLGLEVTIVDNEGRAIPANKIASDNHGKSVALKLSYNGNSGEENISKYGYESTYKNSYDIRFADTDGDGVWTVSSNYIWQYVGEYTVTGMSVTMANNAGVKDGTNVPTMFTITSAAPTAENLKVSTLEQKSDLTFGMNGNNVEGNFLQKYNGANLGALNISLQYQDAAGEWKDAPNAKLAGVTTNLVLDHQGGSDTHGGYTWSGTNPLEDITVAMTDTGNNNRYVAGETTLLAGTYNVSAVVSLADGSTKTVTGKAIEVYSKVPDVTMTEVSPDTSVTVNPKGDVYAYNDGTEYKANNFITSDGKSAVVYAYYVPFGTDNVGTYTHQLTLTHEVTSTKSAGKLADYSMPTIMFQLANDGGYAANFTMTHDKIGTVTFIGANQTGTATIGSVSTTVATFSEEFSYDYGLGVSGTATGEFTYGAEIPEVIGTQEIKTLSAAITHTVDRADYQVNYSFTMNTPLSICQEHEGVPSINIAGVTYQAGNDELIFSAQTGMVSGDGRPIDFVLPKSGDGEKDYHPQQAHYSVNPTVDNAEINDGWSVAEEYTEKLALLIGEEYYDDDKSYCNGNNDWGKQTYNAYEVWYDLYHVYERHVTVYQRTGKVYTYLGKYGVFEWEVNGQRYKPGDTVRVTEANTVAIPIIGFLGNVPGVEATYTQKTETKNKMITQKSTTEFEKRCEGIGQNTQSTRHPLKYESAKNTAITNAASAAKKAIPNLTSDYTKITAVPDNLDKLVTINYGWN